MLLRIHHETRYTYEHVVKYSIQRLLLTPRQEGVQRSRHWNITTSGRSNASLDAFDNPTHLIVVNSPHQEVVVTVNGEVESDAMPYFDHQGGLPLLCFLQETSLTKPSAELLALAQVVRPEELTDDFEAAMLKLMHAIEERTQYEPGSTDVTTTAAESLSRGSGVCQDHAHIFLVCARLLGLPARYVSGYLFTGAGENQHMASHAWADVWNGRQWVSCDTTHKRFSDFSYCRLAVGRDFLDACPVRGMRRGGGSEKMQAYVLVNQVEQ